MCEGLRKVEEQVTFEVGPGEWAALKAFKFKLLHIYSFQFIFHLLDSPFWFKLKLY